MKNKNFDFFSISFLWKAPSFCFSAGPPDKLAEALILYVNFNKVPKVKKSILLTELYEFICYFCVAEEQVQSFKEWSRKQKISGSDSE